MILIFLAGDVAESNDLAMKVGSTGEVRMYRNSSK